jgi:hypothetical protein
LSCRRGRLQGQKIQHALQPTALRVSLVPFLNLLNKFKGIPLLERIEVIHNTSDELCFYEVKNILK